MMRLTQERVAGSRFLALGMLLAALMAAMLLAAKPVHAVTTFTVNSTGDAGDVFLANDVCDASPLPGRQCTLRAAIQEANDTPGADAIDFSILGDSGVKTIKPSSQLPIITEQVTIDGYTQGSATPETTDDARPNTLATGGTNAVLKIELNGEGIEDFASGLAIWAPNSVVRGLVINSFDGDAIGVYGPGNRVTGNFIGTDPSGQVDLGNGFGVYLSSDNATVGGTSPGARNLISGNSSIGVYIFDFDGPGAKGNRVLGNLIGTTRNGTGSLGNDNHGVATYDASDSTVGGDTAAANTIAFNGRDGVHIFGDTGNRVLSNSIFSNAGLGIDLDSDGPTANDPKDPDTGANNRQNFPVLTSARTSAVSTTVRGTLNSTPNKTILIQFFSSPFGVGNQGKNFIGQTNVTTDSNGNASFTFSPTDKVEVGRIVTATATDPEGNTSEFSAPRSVVA